MRDDTEETEDNETSEQMQQIEEDPPQDLEDWPNDGDKYKTMGGPEADTGWDDGATSKLGPAEVQHHEDGTVSVGGEQVDNPDDYKGEPIPGGPTDPDSKAVAGEQDLSDSGSGSGSGGSGDDDG